MIVGQVQQVIRGHLIGDRHGCDRLDPLRTANPDSPSGGHADRHLIGHRDRGQQLRDEASLPVGAVASIESRSNLQSLIVQGAFQRNGVASAAGRSP